MLGFLIGTACLIGLIKVLRGGWRHGNGCGGGHGFGRFGGWGWGGHGHGHGPGFGGFAGGGWGRRGMFRWLFTRLETSPGQEKVILEAADEVREAASKMKGEARASAADIADVLRGPDVDATSLGNLFARHDTAMDGMRKAVVGALAKVHDALDERQRKILADLVTSWSGGMGAGWGHPYRTADNSNTSQA